MVVMVVKLKKEGRISVNFQVSFSESAGFSGARLPGGR